MPNKGMFHPSNFRRSIGGRIVRNSGRLSRRNSARLAMTFSGRRHGGLMAAE
jgi:hypothetical protein